MPVSRVLRAPLLLAIAAVSACAHPVPPPAQDGRPLLSTVQVRALPEGVRFALQVTNVTEAPVRLEFTSGQAFDFVVTRGGAEVWRWSEGRMFSQALRTEVLDAGETRTYGAEWAAEGAVAGEYVVTGVLTAGEHRVEQPARFRIE